ncbi:hypothetical protein CKO15_00290 [Halorhodospira abdelmalekii]|uniref:6-carboxytetrahydropterin synthase n=1 Tax=Halorhodospira abdelmalekii TaxID=421629 RepID=UPI0019049E05|nr:6-carboxytetrahydropterin synthase [Halorhodospira abdelmalekii]MBK1733745.1 hypothetical protein [Halorhodospira abdelmalekii]
MTRLQYTASLPFEAARRDERGWHGHSFRLNVRSDPLSPPTDPEMWLQRCREVIAPLDYSLLNEQCEAIDDATLATHLMARLQQLGTQPARVELRSAPERGAVRSHSNATPHWRWHHFRFEAAHRLPNVPADHPCGRMHGHSYRVVLEAGGDEQAEDLARLWAPIQAQLHRGCLNDILVNPTSERLAEWIWLRLRRHSPGLWRIQVQESEHSGCAFDGTTHTIWKAQRFEAATPAGAAREVHGHGYRLRLYLRAPLDPDLGWTVDYGEVKAAFAPLREALDHRRLDEIAGLQRGDLAELGQWLLKRGQESIPALYRVDIHEDEQRGVIVALDEAEDARG